MGGRGNHREGSPGTPTEPAVAYWPVFAVLPVLVVAQLKAAGLVALGGFDTTLLSFGFLLLATFITFLGTLRYPLHLMLPFILFAVVVLVGISRSSPGEYQARKADEFLVTAVIVACLPVLLRSRRDLRGLLAVWFWGGVLVAALVLVVGGSASLWGRAGIGGATLGPAYLSAAGLVAGSAGLGERLLRPVVAIPGIAVCGVAVITIGSRGPMVGAAAALLVWVLLRGVLRARSVAVLVILCVVAYIGVQQASDVALSRLDFSDSAREALIGMARTAFVNSPVLGMGWGDFSTISGLANIQKYPHNMFWETASELGLLGIVCILGLLVVAAVAVWRRRALPEVRAIAAVAVLMLVGQQFSTDLTNRVFWIAIIPCLLLPGMAPAGRRDRPRADRSADQGAVPAVPALAGARAAAHRQPSQDTP
ncbi:MAG: O-antigen ligase family protein [Candidatus Nanopelagicales bacterium]